ncbi:MAG: copper chaperone PCu(A)C [Sphingobium sp.]
MPFPRLTSAVALFAAPFALVSCADPAPLYVDQAWVKTNANPEAPAAGYFTVHGGEQAVKLLRVTTDGALRVEMHESVMKDGMMTMEPMDSVDIPAKTDVKFAPGGKHVMLFGLNPAVAETGKLTFTMLFSNGDRLIVDAPIQQAGTDAGAMGNMAMPDNGIETGK